MNALVTFRYNAAAPDGCALQVAPASTHLTAAERLAVKLDALGVSFAEICADVLETHKVRVTRAFLNVAKDKARRLAAGRWGVPVEGPIVYVKSLHQAPAKHVEVAVAQRQGWLQKQNHPVGPVSSHKDLVLVEDNFPLSSPLDQLNWRGCRNPVAGAGGSTLFCGAQALAGKSYCAACHKKLCLPPKQLTDAQRSEAARARFMERKRKDKAAAKARVLGVMA